MTTHHPAPGEIRAATLRGPAGPWTIHATAHILDTGARYLLATLTGIPDPSTIEPPHTTHVSALTAPADQPGWWTCTRATTEHLAPVDIHIGPVIGHDHTALDERGDHALTALRPYRRPIAPNAPLGESWLSHLAAWQTWTTATAELADAARRGRDAIVAGLADGNVNRDTIGRIIGTHRTAVPQIRTRHRAAREKMTA
ncbi:hypothetical protein [Kitasatospora cheerisanensis]|uniref:Uncharacterized protein n=1 Tax=Kitasatospora cheerisanensis KCTC 2395 TaxID=1348663 RepID=A0A066YPI0_9ACTN|nr:hypothetical protein [Kitasatospora cheerisanensis]KDN83458.1 hypothetical protein KCH_49400 [Kitasatospora cheerisanensis KCTC 2395]